MKSIWRDIDFPTFESLSGDISTDVLIIGGGISGLLTAYFLDRAGVDYLLVAFHRWLFSFFNALWYFESTVARGSSSILAISLCLKPERA